MAAKRLTTEEFIRRAKEIHGDKYDYSKTEYINARTKVCIFCKQCKQYFWQMPFQHLKGKGCANCRKISDEEILKRFYKVHGDDYDYSNSKFNGVTSKIEIACKQCGCVFYQTVDAHARGNGCPKCATKRNGKIKRLTQEKFESMAKNIHGDKYVYDTYTKSNEKIKIICNDCGCIFYQTPNNHLSGKGCPNCKRKILSQLKSCTLEEFIEKSNIIHNSYYSYINAVYINNYTPIEIICPIHGSFWQQPNNHLQGKGCPKCHFRKLEKEILNILQYNNIQYADQCKFPWLVYENELKLDFYLPQYNIAIECQGGQHFFSVDYFGGEEDFKKRQIRDKLKHDLCKEHGIKILYYSDLKKYDNFLGEPLYHYADEILNEIKSIKI